MNARGQDLTTSIGLLILRLGAGGYMATHGWGKVQLLFAGNFDQIGDPIGLGNVLSLILATTAEFLCSLLVMLGFATRFTAVPVVFAMGVAAFVIHRNDPLTMGRAFEIFMARESKLPPPLSKEPALLFLVPFLALIFTGPGRFSIDAWLWPRWRARRAARGAVAPGTGAGTPIP